MPTFDIVKRTTPRKSFRVAKVMGSFDLQTEKVEERFVGEIPIEQKKWNVGLICGASGTGKSTIARQLFADNVIQSFSYSADNVLDDFPKECSAEQITKMFNAVGFATVWSWLKPYSVLSTGERMRVDLARAILEKRDLIVFDEYTSVVNREVAKIGSAAIQKAVRKMGKQFIAVSCHDDVLQWLEPDWTFNTDKMQFQWRILRRPEIKLEIRKTTRDAWGIFGKYHYLNHELHKASQCFVGIFDNRPVCFFAVLHFPHPKEKRFKRGHRLVVLPDYQGVGIGHQFSTAIAEHYRKEGFRFIITSATKSLYAQRSRDERWRVTRISRTSESGSKSLSKSLSKRKYTFGYEYVGTKNQSNE